MNISVQSDFEVVSLRYWNSSAEAMLPRGSPTRVVKYIDTVILIVN